MDVADLVLVAPAKLVRRPPRRGFDAFFSVSWGELGFQYIAVERALLVGQRVDAVKQKPCA